ncbi:hypothetical protein [Embleya sp. NPDC050493]
MFGHQLLELLGRPEALPATFMMGAGEFWAAVGPWFFPGLV